MKQEVVYRSYYEIDGEKPHIELGFKFKDYFETNNYYLISESSSYKNIENLEFDVLKDEKQIGVLKLENFNVDNFIDFFSKSTNDHDFNKILISEHKEKIKKDLLNFFEYFKKTITENKITLEGEIKRMRTVAGII